MGSDDQGFGTTKGRERCKVEERSSSRRIQEQDVASSDGDFDTWYQKDTPIPCVGKKVRAERHSVVIRDGEDIESLSCSPRDELFGCVLDVIERVLSGMKMKVGLKGPKGNANFFQFFSRFLFHFDQPCLSLPHASHGPCPQAIRKP